MSAFNSRQGRGSTNTPPGQESGYSAATYGPSVKGARIASNRTRDTTNHYQQTPEQHQWTAQGPQASNLSPVHVPAAHNPRFYPSRSFASATRARLFRKSQLNGPGNIVIFGETGTGKSSLVNMLSDDNVAMVSNLATGCTFESTPHAVFIDGVPYTLWDTAGLNEGNTGSVPADQALHYLRDLVDKLKDGVSLLVYCIRGSRYRDIIKVNYDLFTEIICQGEVPVVIVVTGLENEERMEGWWEENAKEFTDRGMLFQSHACVTTSKGKKNMFEAEYEESKHTVRNLIKDFCPGSAWTVDSDQWFGRITNRIQEYWEEYNGCQHHTSRPEREGEGEEISSLFAVIGLFLLSLVQNFSPFRSPNY
ncbi:hypothetical protein AGABI2DRAFT_195962 [Agaricus bisporus var. bisporus H97]|uniref:hypothetical protein n=1 Tax=Agaricus bisporus var. bisporus (strain H97 / ATCC MYA-4626 / FGSC 10389) TaxID=936046 RepID=UPI00029F534C|nr:hypothetical protein AGABI2DRAFT_195962 [Agaricus bisporus var. bisporus H97]EKV42234.1 hypothetical protein AGABI2DRAFT_195962 [Agaricus bisporus var. bisporus H97]